MAYGRFVRGEIDAAIELGERSLELAAGAAPTRSGVAERALGNAWVFRGDIERSAAPPSTQLVAGALASGDDARIAHACYMRSLSLTSTGGADAGMAYAERAAVAAARVRQPHGAGPGRLRHRHLAGVDAARTGRWRSWSAARRWRATSATSGSSCSPAPRRSGCGPSTASRSTSLRAFADVIVGLASRRRLGQPVAVAAPRVRHLPPARRADELAVIVHGALERAGAVHAFPFEPAAAARLANVVDELRERLGEERFRAAEQVGPQRRRRRS